MSCELVKGYLDNEPVSFDFGKQEFTFEKTGAKVHNATAVEMEMVFGTNETVLIGGWPYLKNERAGEFSPLGYDGREVLSFGRVREEGLAVTVPLGGVYADALERAIGDDVEGPEWGNLVPVYLDNVPFLVCPEEEVFFSSKKGGIWLGAGDVAALKLTIAHYPIVEVRKGLYFRDDVGKRLVRVGDCSERIEGAAYGRVCSGGALRTPLGGDFKAAVAREQAYCERREREDREWERG